MDNVHDLKQTSERIARNTPNQQPISLSALGSQHNQSQVSINATNGLTGINNDDDNRDHQVVRINPNPARKKAPRRTIEDPSELNQIDPNDVIPQRNKTIRSITPRDKAMGELASAVQRKQDEYRAFVQSAIEADAENRERVEAGLEEVNGEMQYMPENLHTPISEDQKVTASAVSEEDDFFSDEDITDNSGFEDPTPSANTRIMDYDYDEEEPEQDDFFAEDEESEYEEDEPDDVVDDIPTEDHYNEYIDKDNNEEIDEAYDTYYPNIDVNVDDEESTNIEEPVEEEEVTYEPESKNVVITSTLNDNISSSDFDVDEADFEDVTNETEENLTDDQIKALDRAAEKNLRSDVLKKIIKAGKRVNTAQFTVSNKVVHLKDAMRNIKKVERTATWPMMFAGRPFVATALKGPEIAMLAELEESNNSGFGINREQARIIYEHDASPYRPSTLEAWCKTIPLADLDNIYTALYIASMNNANYLPMICQKPSCRHAYLSDDIPVESMIKIEKDETKKRFESIRRMELTSESSGSYESVITVINNNFAIGIKMPSVFNALYEYNTLNNEFISKYASIIAVMQYIDYVYMIDPDTSQFHPVGWKTYFGDYAKTYKSKIATYAKIFKEFSSTDFTLMTSIIDSMVVKEADTKIINLEVPAAKCPKCGSEIPANVMSARQMLFTQQRLVTLATIPIEK